MANELTNFNDGVNDFLNNYLGQGFNDFFKDGFKMPAMPDGRADVTDDGKAYHVTAELPGFKKANIHLDYRHNVLTVQAKHAVNKKQTNKKGEVLEHEISNQNVYRQFTLPSVDFNKISASYDGGLLKVNLPKLAKAVHNSHRITIK